MPSSHFALLRNRLDFSGLDTRFPFTLFLPQRRTEELLEQHLAELGVPYLRRHVVTGLRPTSYGADDRASHATNDTGSYGRTGTPAASSSTWTPRMGPSSSAPPTWSAATAPPAWSATRPGSSSRVPRTPGGPYWATSSWPAAGHPGADGEHPGRVDVHDRDRRRPVPDTRSITPPCITSPRRR